MVQTRNAIVQGYLIVACIYLADFQVGAQTRPSEGCRAVNNESGCLVYPGCKVSETGLS